MIKTTVKFKHGEIPVFMPNEFGRRLKITQYLGEYTGCGACRTTFIIQNGCRFLTSPASFLTPVTKSEGRFLFALFNMESNCLN